MFDFHERTIGLATQMPSTHGPRGLCARFVDRAERMASGIGVKLTFEQDFELLSAVHRESRKTGAILSSNFDAAAGYDGHQGWWICGRDAVGEVVTTIAARIYDWPDTSMGEEVESLRFLYQDVERWRLPNERCTVSAAAARKITGRVFYGGGAWVRPDFRSKGLSSYLPRLSKVYGLARYDFDWATCVVEPMLARKGVCKRYGFDNIEFGIHFGGTRFGDHDSALCWLSRDEFIDDLAAVERSPEVLGA